MFFLENVLQLKLYLEFPRNSGKIVPKTHRTITVLSEMDLAEDREVDPGSPGAPVVGAQLRRREEAARRLEIVLYRK